MSGEMRRKAAPGPAGRADGGAGPSSERRRPAERTGGARVLSSRGPAAEEPERGALRKAAGLRLRRAARPAQRGLRRGVPLYKLPAAADGGPHTPFRPSEYAKREKFVSFPCPMSAGRDGAAPQLSREKGDAADLIFLSMPSSSRAPVGQGSDLQRRTFESRRSRVCQRSAPRSERQPVSGAAAPGGAPRAERPAARRPSLPRSPPPRTAGRTLQPSRARQKGGPLSPPRARPPTRSVRPARVLHARVQNFVASAEFPRVLHRRAPPLSTFPPLFPPLFSKTRRGFSEGRIPRRRISRHNIIKEILIKDSKQG